MEDIRYIQRFENYEKSFLLLKDSLQIADPSIVEKGGVIQFFEVTFELSWKLMKDYLEYQGYEVNSPRESIKRSFSINLIENGSLWIDALMDRNLTTHTYEQARADRIYKKIKNEYFLLLEYLYHKFRDDICTD